MFRHNIYKLYLKSTKRRELEEGSLRTYRCLIVTSKF